MSPIIFFFFFNVLVNFKQICQMVKVNNIEVSTNFLYLISLENTTLLKGSHGTHSSSIS